MAKKRVLVLCTGNSCRSQMAEGLINRYLGTEWEAYSAGTRPAGYVHELAVEADGYESKLVPLLGCAIRDVSVSLDKKKPKVRRWKPIPVPGNRGWNKELARWPELDDEP